MYLVSMIKNLETHILKLSCKDQVGIVAKTASILASFNCNIVESKQFTDQENNNFFIRIIVFTPNFFWISYNTSSIFIFIINSLNKIKT